MKILKIKVKLVDGPAGSVIYCYPIDYKDHGINILVYGSEVQVGNEKSLYCLALANDSFATDLPEDVVTEVSREEADVLGRAWKPPVMKILNQKLVDNIITRLKNGIPLTWMEINALDPSNESVGINYSKEFDINDFLN